MSPNTFTATEKNFPRYAAERPARKQDNPALRGVRDTLSAVLPDRSELIHRSGFGTAIPLVLKELREKNSDILTAIEDMYPNAPQFSRTTLGAYFTEKTFTPAFKWIGEHQESHGLGRVDAKGSKLVPVNVRRLTDDAVKEGITHVLHHHIRTFFEPLFSAKGEETDAFDERACKSYYEMTYQTSNRDPEAFLCLGADTAVEQTLRVYRNVLPWLFCLRPSVTPVSQRLAHVRKSVGKVLQRLSSVPAKKFEKFSGRPGPKSFDEYQLFDLLDDNLVITKELPKDDIGCAGVYARIGSSNAIEAMNDLINSVTRARAISAEERHSP